MIAPGFTMKIIHSIKEMQAESDRLREDGLKIGFVPTMGFLHEGHLSLIREAGRRSDRVVLSIYVNPTQFGPKEDFSAYPRDFERDCRLAEAEGTDVIFGPSDAEMYPAGCCTHVDVDGLTETLCGASRPGHFRGVTTVVTKLFTAVKPHLAVFGQKDAQQAAVIRRMTVDLNLDVEIVIAPIVREADGLAMSSRNVTLSPSERADATVLRQSLLAAGELFRKGERDASVLVRSAKTIIESKPSARIDYVSIADPDTLQPLDRARSGDLMAVAVFVGKTRLIDNLILP
jgi:pantoate--beta-alanine ligase